MKKTFVLPALAILFVFAGCSVSKLDTASAGAKYDKDTKKTAPLKPYEVSERDNIARVSFINTHGPSTDIEVTFDRGSNANVPRDIRFQGSSGSVENTHTFRGFKDVQFPFTGTVEYYIKPRLSSSTVGGSRSGSTTTNDATDLRCRLTFTVNEPGSWNVKVTN